MTTRTHTKNRQMKTPILSEEHRLAVNLIFVHQQNLFICVFELDVHSVVMVATLTHHTCHGDDRNKTWTSHLSSTEQHGNSSGKFLVQNDNHQKPKYILFATVPKVISRASDVLVINLNI